MTLRGNIAEMHIRNIQPEDVGEYSCVFGEQKTTAEVNVRGIQHFIPLLIWLFSVLTFCHTLAVSSLTSGSVRVL